MNLIDSLFFLVRALEVFNVGSTGPRHFQNVTVALKWFRQMNGHMLVP